MLDPIKSPLEYFEISKGTARLSKLGDYYSLTDGTRGWMGYDTKTFWQAEEFFFELDLAYGVCVTTGLGLGIIQTLLSRNENVKKIIVYEKNQDIIDVFHDLAEKNNFDTSKIEIKNINADDMKNESCDCLFIDHFEGESEKEILEKVYKIEKDNICKILWYWPAAFHYFSFVEKNRFVISIESYEKWKSYTNLDNLPDTIDERLINKFNRLRNKYLHDSSGMFKQTIKNFENRNKLIEKFGKRGKNELGRNNQK